MSIQLAKPIEYAIESVNANPVTGDVMIEGIEFDLEKIKFVVEDIGYNYKGVREG